jgi:hypothetical protein
MRFVRTRSLSVRNHQLEAEHERLEEEVRLLRQGQKPFKQVADRAPTTTVERREQVQTAERGRDERRRWAENADAQVARVTAESQATAKERQERTAAQQRMCRQWEQELQSCGTRKRYNRKETLPSTTASLNRSPTGATVCSNEHIWSRPCPVSWTCSERT